MRVASRPWRGNPQRLLWEIPLLGHGDVRGTLGDFAERLLALFLRGERIQTTGDAEYCPDVRALGVWFECKAAGRSRQTFIYEGRLAKDRAFALAHPLFYAIFHHGTETKLYSTREELRRAFLLSLRGLYIVPFEAMDRLCQERKLEPLNSQYGGSNANPLYGAGYRIPLSLLRGDAVLWIPFELEEAGTDAEEA